MSAASAHGDGLDGLRIVDVTAVEPIEPAGHHGALSRSVAEFEARGRVTLKLCEMEAGGYAEAHAHDDATQVLLVVSGELTVSGRAEDSLEVPTGRAAVLEPGAAHEVRNDGTAPARYVALTAAAPDPGEGR